MIRHDYPDPVSCAVALADALAAALGDALSDKPRATLALSGGRSPETVLPRLAAMPVDWARVDVTLVDDRRVPADDPASNAGLVRRCFLEAGADKAIFHPLWTAGTDVGAACADADARLAPLLPVDVGYLGMGPDGHIASLFPADDAAGFERDGFAVILSEAPSAPRGRISLTMSKLINTGRLFLHATGAAKLAALDDALQNGPTPRLPVSLLLDARPDTQTFVCA